MIIGVPKEIKNNENRVGMTPAGVAELVKRGHTVYVQASAGTNSGFPDEEYTAVGAKMLPTIEATYAAAEMIVKVKEPIAPEYKLIKKGQVVFTYFHFAADKILTEAMIESGGICIAYETVEKEDRSLPLLTPMSEVAGRMATQVGARFLEKPQGGKRKTDGWRDRCTPRTGACSGWWHRRNQRRADSRRHGCRSPDYGHQPLPPPLPQRSDAEEREDTLFLHAQHQDGASQHRPRDRFRPHPGR